ncbi:hypothetical protein ACFO1B_23330 [Dactylosporangium siamense]|uniref:Uncharacterized protein n=1 Tax=Dactylosporangium siamense TaxID=685454 RepID=A0A919PNB9_9ACTN|nr:hypothetical protein [Dactylosporangium siamense]GIG47129.1 hypothetical protein Dsi01nite_051700 [Dactylosporangium siamense]
MDGTNPGFAHLIRDGALRRIMANPGLHCAALTAAATILLAAAARLTRTRAEEPDSAPATAVSPEPAT